MKTVVIPPIVDWSFLKQLPQQMASQFAKNGYKVFYCNKNRTRMRIDEVEPNLFVFHDYSSFIDMLKSDKLQIDVLYTTWAMSHEWVDLVKPKTTVYHSCDSFEEWKSHENTMLKKSDIVLCTSQYIYDLRCKNHDNVHIVRNGCSSDYLTRTPILPEDMKFYMHPRFIFSGAIGVWVSTYLMRKISECYPTFLVGCEFGKGKPQEMIALGVKNHDDLFNYYCASDVSLLPFNTKYEITLAANPIKLWESLACGIPVLATSWGETELDELKGVVFTTNNTDEYVELAHQLGDMCAEEKKVITEKAKSIALNNTWEKRFEIIEKCIKEI